MGACCTQDKVDEVVTRVKKCVPWVRPRLGRNELADSVRRYYEMFHRLPEYVALVLLESSLDKVEIKMAKQTKSKQFILSKKSK